MSSFGWGRDDWQRQARQQIDTKNQRIAAVLVPPGPLGPFHPAHRYITHPAEAPLRMSSTPLLRLATELHLEIFSYIRAHEDDFGEPHAWLWAVLALRGASRFFRNMLPPLTHDELLDLELTMRATSRGLQACRYCLRLRHMRHFSQAQTRNRGVPIDGVLGWAGNSVKSSQKRMKRFCVECGFAKTMDPGIEVGNGRYGIGSEVVVGVGEGERWVWCWWCRRLKKGEDAGTLGEGVCAGSCVACCTQHECIGGCVREEQAKRKAATKEWLLERRDLFLD
jgi:hypothetical protein